MMKMTSFKLNCPVWQKISLNIYEQWAHFGVSKLLLIEMFQFYQIISVKYNQTYMMQTEDDWKINWNGNNISSW